jgi:hypothetical protein
MSYEGIEPQEERIRLQKLINQNMQNYNLCVQEIKRQKELAFKFYFEAKKLSQELEQEILKNA